MAQANLTAEIDQQIAANKVMMFSKSWCPHCTTAKNTLKSKGIQFGLIELDQRGDGDQLQAALQAKSGQRTVPNLFINGEHLGGNSDLQTANNNGSLAAKLA